MAPNSISYGVTDSMKKHIPIVIGLLILGTALAPVLGATLIGVIEGDPLFVFAPAVIPIAFMLVGPPAFIMSLSLVCLGLWNISQDKSVLRLSGWVKQFTLAGTGLGALSVLYMGFLAVWVSELSLKDALTGCASFLIIAIPVGILCGLLFAGIWYLYAQRLFCKKGVEIDKLQVEE